MAQDRVEAVERALCLLEAFTPDDQALSLKELAARTGLYKSTILRLAGSLDRHGFMLRSATGDYRLGPALGQLGAIYRRQIDPGAVIRPTLAAIGAALNESVAFYVRAGEERLCLYRHNAARAIRHQIDEGARLPLSHGAAGHILRAFDAGDAGGDATLRSQGICLSRGERDPEVAALAVPVHDPAGVMRGALSVSGPIARFDDAFCARAAACLRHHARNLGAQLPPGEIT